MIQLDIITLGDRLTALRVERSWTIEQVATMTGVARNSLLSYESGHCLPGPKNVAALEALYGVSLKPRRRDLVASLRRRLESIADHGPTDDLDRELMAAACVAAAYRAQPRKAEVGDFQGFWSILSKRLMNKDTPAPPGRTEVSRCGDRESPHKGAEALTESNRENRSCSRGPGK